jgi:hypothetical protein
LEAWRKAQAQAQAQQNLADELDQLRKDHEELIRLRAEAAGLNSKDLQMKLERERELDQARAKLAAAQAATHRIQEDIDAENLRTKRVNDLKQLGLAARIFATHQDGSSMPTSFEQLTNELGFAIDLGPYEYVQHGRSLSMSDPEMILLREKEPRRLPNGKWTRSYTLVDGAVLQIGSDTGDYQEWERPRIAPPEKTK